jgi:hypothetical protein
MGLVIDLVELQGQRLNVVAEPIGFNLAEPARLRVLVSEASLAAFLEAQSPAGLQNFEITATGNKLIVVATKRVIVEIRATAICSLRIADGTKLYVDLDSVELPGGGSLTNLVRSQLEAINPIFDLATLPVNARMNSVIAEGGFVVLEGEVLSAR